MTAVTAKGIARRPTGDFRKQFPHAPIKSIINASKRETKTDLLRKVRQESSVWR